ncbi:hypothetical protein Aperf_G00000000909 [Anoplocephala perfoliata]
MNVSEEDFEVPKVALASWNFEEVSTYLSVSLFILIILIMKYGYHKLKWIASYIPESLILIVVGLLFGTVVRYVPTVAPGLKNFRLTHDLFFYILLPPIILESAYSLFNRTFADYFVPIMLFAVVGTVLNFLLIGFGMWGVDQLMGLGNPPISLPMNGYLLFASLIIAVDPVAVLAIFQDIGVEPGLYYMVFGESLLNDAVTVVLYNIMSAFLAAKNIYAGDILIGIGSFFTVSLGGALVGLIFGTLSCLITRLKALSGALPLVLMSYISYLAGDLFGWSGIISMIVCGVFQAAYAFHNVMPLKILILHNGIGQLSSICEAVIFLMLGLEVMAADLVWHTGFIVTAIILCLFARTLVTFVLSAIINHNRSSHSKINWSTQVIISYGGLRGAVAFSLADIIHARLLGELGGNTRSVIVTATLVIILFTVAFMGLTMKPLVRLLDINLAKDEENKLLTTLNDSVINQTLVYMETLIGEQGYNHLREFFYRLDDKYVRPFLQKHAMQHNQKILNVYEEVALKFHTEAIKSRKMLNDTELEKDDTQASRGDVAAQTRPVSPLTFFRIPTIEIDALSDEDEDSVFQPTVRLNLPERVRRRVQVASMYQGDNPGLYTPHRTAFHGANDAHFAKFTHEQQRLVGLLGEHPKANHKGNLKSRRAVSIDSSTPPSNRFRLRHKKLRRTHTENITANQNALTLTPEERAELLNRQNVVHHFYRSPGSPKSPSHPTSV